MKNIKLSSLLFACSLLLLFILNSFKSKTDAETCREYLYRMNWTLKKSVLANQATANQFQTCVNSFSNDGKTREEFITNAYYNLMVYYRNIGRKDLAAQYKGWVGQENIKRYGGNP